jgi:hypothetical protein
LVVRLRAAIEPFVHLEFQCGAVVRDHTIVYDESDEIRPCRGRHARGISAIATPKTGASLGKGIYSRRSWSVIAIAAQVIGSKTVDVKIDDSENHKLREKHSRKKDLICPTTVLNYCIDTI